MKLLPLQLRHTNKQNKDKRQKRDSVLAAKIGLQINCSQTILGQMVDQLRFSWQ